MSRLKKLGVPKELEPTLELLDKIADGEDIDYDILMVVKNIGLMQYYLKGKLDGMKVIGKTNKIVATTMIGECNNDLKLVLDIVTGIE